MTLKTGTMSLEVSMYPAYTYGPTRKVRGRFLQFAALMPLVNPASQMRLAPIQFLGVHDYLVMTIMRPAEINTLYKINTALPRISSTSKTHKVVWLGPVRQYPTPASSHGLRYYIPSRLWKPSNPIYDNKITFEATIEVHAISKRHSFAILSIPSLTKEMLLR